MQKTKIAFHPDYIKSKDNWEFFLHSYEGGRQYFDHGVSSYLYAHARETNADYKFRSKRAVFESISQVVVDTYKNHIRRKGITRKVSNPKSFGEFFENCDRSGHNLDYFMLEKAFLSGQVFGACFILIDLPSNGSEISSEYHRKQSGIIPYLTCYYPTDLVNWQYSNGRFDWVFIEESDYEKIDNPLELKKTQKSISNYKVWTTTNYTILNSNGAEVDTQPHNWKCVPISIVYNRESLLYNLPIGLSAINLIAELDRKCFNLSSLLDEFLYRQCFAQLVLDKEMLGKILETGSTRVLLGDLESLQPYFLTPPSDPAQFIVAERNRTVEAAYRFAMIRDNSSIEKKGVESGVSKAYDLHDSNQNIAQKAKNCESAENNIHKLLEPFYGKVVASYPTDFDIKSLNEELEQGLAFLKANLGSITYEKHKKLKLIARDLENTDPELLMQIKSEIDNNDSVKVTELVNKINDESKDDEREV